MKQPLFVQNTPIDEKRISFIEKVVSRLARRSKKQSSAIFTPYPISSCVTGDVNGEALRYLFCADGTISKCMIVLNKKPEAGIRITISIEGELEGNSFSFIAMKRVSTFKPDVKISAGSKLIVSIEVVDPETDKVDEVWIGFLWVPTVKDTHVKRFLIDSLDKEASDVLEA